MGLTQSISTMGSSFMLSGTGCIGTADSGLPAGLVAGGEKSDSPFAMPAKLRSALTDSLV